MASLHVSMASGRHVIACRAPTDIAAAITFARERGLTIAARSGGHCFAGRSSDGDVIIDVSPMNSVGVRGDLAVVGAGARLTALYDSLAAGGRTLPAGSGPTVGISGLTLGGGLGFLGRRYGLTCDRLVSARVVLADGEVLDCDERNDPDLFWALRGGGAGFGVVTSLTFAAVPASPMTGFHLAWPHIHAARLVETWQSWSPAAPPELAASLLVTAGRQRAVHVFGALLGDEPAAHALLTDLVAEASTRPAQAFVRQRSSLDAGRYLTELSDQMRAGWPAKPVNPRTLIRSGYFTGPLPSPTVTDLIAGLFEDHRAGEYRELDFTPWGGAYNSVSSDATAFPHRTAAFLLRHAAEVDADADPAPARCWLDKSWATARPWSTGGVYLNFPDPALGPDALSAYYAGNLPRLLRVKANYDPDSFFRLG
jgi:FAD/FMN-containing dehydrogenase